MRRTIKEHFKITSANIDQEIKLNKQMIKWMAERQKELKQSRKEIRQRINELP